MQERKGYEEMRKIEIQQRNEAKEQKERKAKSGQCEARGNALR